MAGEGGNDRGSAFFGSGITRRDFLDGVLLGIDGALLACPARDASGVVPPGCRAEPLVRAVTDTS
jgi:hypothetical protein